MGPTLYLALNITYKLVPMHPMALPNTPHCMMEGEIEFKSDHEFQPQDLSSWATSGKLINWSELQFLHL